VNIKARKWALTSGESRQPLHQGRKAAPSTADCLGDLVFGREEVMATKIHEKIQWAGQLFRVPIEAP